MTRRSTVVVAVSAAVFSMAAAILAREALAEQAASQPFAVQSGFIDSGGSHTCVVLRSGSVRCWGEGDFGRLGQGGTDDVGDDEFPSQAASTPLGQDAAAISSGFAHTCALLADRTVRCWGAGSGGRLGNGSSESVGDDPAEMPPPPVPLGGGAVAISAGGTHTCAILVDDSAHCWGDGARGKLGTEDTDDVGDDPGEMPPAVLEAGGNVRAISAGRDHTCAIVALGGGCWGSSDFGQLGYGSTGAIGDGAGEMPPPEVDIGEFSLRAVTAGDLHTCGLLGSGSVRCWGTGASGRLGYRSITNIGDNPGVTPGTFPTVPLGDFTTADVADLRLSLETGSASTVVGRNLTIDVTVRDDGFLDGRGVVVALALPRGLRYIFGPIDPATGLVPIGTVQGEDSETRRIVTRVVDPGALRVGAEIAAASTFDPDSTPGNGAVGEDDRATATVEAKVRPVSLRLVASPRRDDRGRIRFAASGRLAVSGGDALVCHGGVAVRVRAGAREIASRRAPLRLGGGECSYRAPFSLGRRGLGRRRALRVSARFPGNSVALPRAAKPETVRIR